MVDKSEDLVTLSHEMRLNPQPRASFNRHLIIVAGEMHKSVLTDFLLCQDTNQSDKGKQG